MCKKGVLSFQAFNSFYGHLRAFIGSCLFHFAELLNGFNFNAFSSVPKLFEQHENLEGVKKLKVSVMLRVKIERSGRRDAN
jgi:hypothetical protein